MVMKDLRKQTPVFITYSRPHVIMYSAHAVRRYKERLGIGPESDFVDVCKHMVLNGCSRPRIFGDMSKIYGTNINHRQINFTSVNGAYMGYVDGKTEVLHAETFLSINELRKDQLYLDANNSEDLILWKAAREAFAKGEITLGELKSQSESYTTDIAISDGRIIKLTQEEARLRDEANKKAISDPEYFEKAKEEIKNLKKQYIEDNKPFPLGTKVKATFGNGNVEVGFVVGYETNCFYKIIPIVHGMKKDGTVSKNKRIWVWWDTKVEAV
jgi:hypothetical protein